MTPDLHDPTEPGGRLRPSTNSPRSGGIVWFGVAVAAVGIALAGLAASRYEDRQVLDSRYADLRSIAQLKVHEIASWRHEREADARLLSRRGAILSHEIADATVDVRELVPRLTEPLRAFRDELTYDDALLATADGQVLASASASHTTLAPEAADLVARASRGNGPAIGDFYRCSHCGQIHIDVASPLANRSAVLGVVVLVLRTDPRALLYPLIQAWPTPSASAETLLVRRDGQHVLYMNDLRHRADMTLGLRRSLEDRTVPAVQAVLGTEGRFVGRDYRGEDVLADLRAVPTSNWFMVAKVDLQEVRAESRVRNRGIALISVLAIGTLGASVGFATRRHQRNLLRARLAHESASLEESKRSEARLSALVTKLDETVSALRASEERFRTTLYSIGDGLIATDADGRVQYINTVAERLTGWPEADARGRAIDEVFRIADEKTGVPVPTPVRRVLETGTVVGLANHTVLIARDGTSRPVADSGAPIRSDDGSVHGVVLVFRDQTEDRRRDDYFRHAQRMDAVGRLAGGVAHDFNNLLSVIMSYSDMTIDALPEGAPVRRDLQQVRSAADKAAALTRQLLAFSRQQRLTPQVIDVGEVVTAFEQILQRLVGEHIQLRVHTMGSAGSRRARVDRGQLEQVLMNLAANARDAMPDGGSVEIRVARVTLDVAYTALHPDVRPGAYVELSVTDTGTGMDPVTRLHLFEPFFTTKAAGRGTGLGLATVFGIVKQSGGHIVVDSELGHGASFLVNLPAVDAAVDVPSAEAVGRAEFGGSESILVAEDDPAVRDLVARVLGLAGYQVMAVEDGQAALERCTAEGAAIDLILCDVIMPVMGGTRLASTLLRRDIAIPVVFMSGHGQEALEAQGGLNPDAPFLSKPFTTTALLQRVRETLDRRTAGHR